MINPKELRQRVIEGDPAAIEEMERQYKEAREKARARSPMDAKDWESLERLIDAGEDETRKGLFLAKVAERLKMGLPATMTRMEMLAAEAEAIAFNRVHKNQGASLSFDEIARLAPEVEKRFQELGEKALKSSESPEV